jgi:pSer/pThr/pTyr-binding forkhead associated (FHA) protein
MWILRSADAPEESPLTFRVLPGGMKTVGRAGRADFVVDAALVSRVHCRLVSGPDGQLEVEDLKSTNGTFVNDRRIKKAVLAPGDRLRVGRVELIVTRDRTGAHDSPPPRN